jgi:FAD synthetase
MTRRVMAQGTFEVLHPGHVHYLREAAAMGDELHVVVSRPTNVDHKEAPVLPARQRRDVVAALGPVDNAVMGHPEDIFVPVERLDPDVIVLGHDQHHSEGGIEEALADRGIDCEVRRASGREPRYEAEILSSRGILEAVADKRGVLEGSDVDRE